MSSRDLLDQRLTPNRDPQTMAQEGMEDQNANGGAGRHMMLDNIMWSFAFGGGNSSNHPFLGGNGATVLAIAPKIQP
jgi:hypothetical protein